MRKYHRLPWRARVTLRPRFARLAVTSVPSLAGVPAMGNPPMSKTRMRPQWRTRTEIEAHLENRKVF